MSHHQHLYSNTSAGPLPTIPRRASSTRQAAASLASPSKRSPDPSSTMRPRSSSSSSESDTTTAHLSIRARRARSAQTQGHFPPALANPMPSLTAVLPAPGGLRSSKTEDNIATLATQKSVSQFLYSPGMSLRFGLENRTPTTLASSSKSARASDDSKLIRKKSGQLVKPSLKTSRSATGSNGLSMFSSSKSEPATPVCKAVHFDSQLEHVKLFLAEQKPLAVSRDGSPTDDTSGTDSDFPSFIFGSDHDSKRNRMKLIIRVVNMPTRINMRADVCLEELTVSSGNNALLGRVRVRNIAYVKTVAVRFTFDSWQTTSEVVGHYHDSPCPNFDRFGFTIKLDDLLARIEEKTLVLAVRYSVAGHEYWDNNVGQDYIANFSRSAPRDRSLSDEESSENLVSLQTKLEKVSQTKDRTGPAFATSSIRSSPEPEEPSFKSTSSLASRYDFNASFKNPWKYHDSPPTSHQRNNSYPQFAKPTKTAASSKSIPALGSPRDLCDGVIPDTPVSALTNDAPFGLPQQGQEGHGRNHRRGYFDLSTFGAANVRRTPPTSPPPRSPEALSPASSLGSPLGGNLYSFPSLDTVVTSKASADAEIPRRPPPLISGLFPDLGFESELSTPSLTTPNSSRSTTPSPTEQFLSLPSLSDEETSREPETYRDLINQYCFFTGGTQAQQDDSSFHFNFAKDITDSVIHDSPIDSTPKPFPQSRMRSPPPVTESSSSSSTDDDLICTPDSITPTASRLNLHLDLKALAQVAIPPTTTTSTS